MAVLLAYFGIALIVILSVVVPLAVGRWLSDRDRALEAAEVAAIEASALALLAGRGPDERWTSGAERRLGS